MYGQRFVRFEDGAQVELARIKSITHAVEKLGEVLLVSEFFAHIVEAVWPLNTIKARQIADTDSVTI
jgi:hypothetical protein